MAKNWVIVIVYNGVVLEVVGPFGNEQEAVEYRENFFPEDSINTYFYKSVVL